QFLVIDSGWYGSASNWWDQVGDWDVNVSRFPGGMKEVADYIRSKGMIPGLWFEMESVTHAGKYFNDYEHLLKKDGFVLQCSNRHFWDMEDPWVIEYLSKKVIGQLRDSGFGYIKVDYNDTYGMGCDGAESLGEALRRKVLASQQFFKKIKAEIPDMMIENCSSGGHRLEPSWMQICSQASFSDAHEITSIPIIAANMHRVIRPEQSQIWAVLRASDSENRLYYSLISTFLGRMCLSGDIYDLSEEQWKIVEEAMAFYHEASDIIKNGKTILQKVSAKSYNAPTGEQTVVREWENRGLVIVHRFAQSEPVEPAIPKGAKVLAAFGKAEEDFSAKAWIYEKGV
ncbi:MAG: alpha-galactosidase, partial [Acetatifactor sp.]|nr:alpha-galactosidase [Acetatifactor sp.]